MPNITRGVWRVDTAPLQPCKRLDDGSVRCDALMTRTGIFRYLLPDGSVRRELRTADDVFDDAALRSFDGRPVTDDHPHNLVTAGTVGDVAVGAVNNPHRDDDHVRASLTVWNPDVVRKMESGKLELSGGYVCDTEEAPGTHPVWGPFDARQVRIFGTT